ncbi:hypothetical protein LCGC14_0609680 [marine sediment metagenome]|uniref:Uncharacterized protein n=1 Tax=marine sediment metagenome TaxID=412755 RepID=A0A0F9TUD2_9ZZZZ
MSRFTTQFFSYFDSLKRILKTLPLNLGGVSASGGGSGGPPGGFLGYLPQTQVAYDLTEASLSGWVEEGAVNASGVVVSGSLLDNLNHIRYRIEQIEPSGVNAGIAIYDGDELIATGITIVNFDDGLDVTQINVDKVRVTSTLDASGATTSGIYNEELTSQIPASGNLYTTSEIFLIESLIVHYNGLRQNLTEDYTEESDNQSFITVFSPVSGDELIVDYLISADGVVGSGGADSFLGLNDTPDSYVGESGKAPLVLSTEDGLDFEDIITPSGLAVELAIKSDVGHDHDDDYYTQVQISGFLDDKAENFLELDDTPSDYTGDASLVLVVNPEEDGIEFIPLSGTGWTVNHQWYVDGVLSTQTEVAGAFIVTEFHTIDYAYIYCKDLGTSGSTIIDVNINGTTIFTPQSGRPELAWDDSDKVARSDLLSGVEVYENDVVTIDIDQIAAGVRNLSVILRLLRP